MSQKGKSTNVALRKQLSRLENKEDMEKRKLKPEYIKKAKKAEKDKKKKNDAEQKRIEKLSEKEINAELLKESNAKTKVVKNQLMKKTFSKYDIEKLNKRELDELAEEKDRSNLFEGKTPFKFKKQRI